MAEYILHGFLRIARDFVPETFGRLTTIGPRFRVGCRSMQVCQCSCGNARVYAISNLQAKRTQSCGCLNSENRKINGIRHGHTANGVWSEEYKSYVCMRGRCLCPTNNRYASYALKGITICQRWLEPNGKGFLNFLADLGPKPSPDCSIERKDPTGNYHPENCCWIPNAQQAKNKRNTIYITAMGKTQCSAAWAEETGIPNATIKARLRRGWTHHDAVTKPVRIDSRNKEKHLGEKGFKL